jgi:hypothetical protein
MICITYWQRAPPYLGYGPVEGSCGHGNEISSFIKNGKYLSGFVTGGMSRRAQNHEVSYILIKYQFIN